MIEKSFQVAWGSGNRRRNRSTKANDGLILNTEWLARNGQISSFTGDIKPGPEEPPDEEDDPLPAESTASQ